MYAATPQPLALGWLEPVMLPPYPYRLIAKLDTGAKTSSLYAINVRHFTRNNQSWVSFEVPLRKQQKTLKFSKPLVRTVKIKLKKKQQPTNSKNYIKRPVVMMPICIDQHKISVEVSLANRKNFLYPMLIGRKTLQALHAQINVNKTYTSTPSC
ncbi:MAG: ATP-dependent zinc protease [Gammaproteobacteria bacterium]